MLGYEMLIAQMIGIIRKKKLLLLCLADVRNAVCCVVFCISCACVVCSVQ